MEGERLKALRDERDILQRELAAIFNMSQQGISQYETGEREPDGCILRKLADYFGVSTDYLLGRIDIRESPLIYISENIKLVMGDMSLEDFIADFRQKTGFKAINESDLQGYLDGKLLPMAGLISCIADYAGVPVDFFYRKNDLSTYKAAKESHMLVNEKAAPYNTVVPPEFLDFVTNPENRKYMLFALKLQQSGVDIEAIDNILNTIISQLKK